MIGRLTKRQVQADVYNPHFLVMKKWVFTVLCIWIAISILVLFAVSFNSPPMYEYDDNDQQKVCPNNYLNSMLSGGQTPPVFDISALVESEINEDDVRFDEPKKCSTYFNDPD